MMVMESAVFKKYRPAPKLSRQRRRTKTAPGVFIIVVTVVMSQFLVSKALLTERSIKRPHFSLIGKRSRTGSGRVPTLLPLYASVKSTNKKARKRKPKHLRKQKNGNSYSSSSSSTKPTGQSVSEDELYSHLDSKLNYGKHGPIGPRQRSRGILEESSDDITNSISDRQREQQFFLRQLNNRPTLVLNANYVPLGYMPLSLWTWQDAVKAVFKGSVTVVDVYPDITVRTSNIKVPLPSVIALNDYVPQKMNKPAFTRRNVYLRDEYKCQYCMKRFQTADLSLDHVHPRSMGGPLSWENAVTCCKKCNCRKGSTPLAEIGRKGMQLNRTPRCPSQMELAAISGRMVPKRVHPTWKPYLGIQERPAASSTDASNGKKGDEEFIDDRYFEEEY